MALSGDFLYRLVPVVHAEGTLVIWRLEVRDIDDLRTAVTCLLGREPNGAAG